MASKFPFDENTIKVCFSWVNAFGKPQTISSFSLGFEKACLLFNIGAIYGNLGVIQDQGTVVGLKQATIYFQQAAGVFHHLLHDPKVVSDKGTNNTDFLPSTLKCLENVMLAQAQECFWQKSLLDNLKDAIVARLAEQVAIYYDIAHEASLFTSAVFTPVLISLFLLTSSLYP